MTFIENLKTIGFEMGIKFISVVLVLVIGFKLVNIIEKRLLKSRSWISIDPTLKSFLRSFMKMGLKAMVLVTAIYTTGIEMTTFVAVIGAAGLAIGLALQGSLSNLAGGVLIITLRPFKVGDYIEGAGQAGTVTDIGLFYTNLTTPDNKAVIIPNASIANSSVVNYGVFPTRRVDLEFSVSYQSAIKDVKRVISNVVDQNSLILREPEPFVRLAKHGSSSLDFKVRVWVNASDYWDVYFTLIEEIKEAFDREGIDIPYPHLVVISNNEN
ncbi:mechanosensitive ion channel [Fusibacter bizertensis]|uniref:Mechanosensitive ion channel n=1 Tax=Fusibacter bizertensis TaxID=1488331 RepID=A0ABT6NHM7_9FIRM|nr:mechanosensitive ion channel domain-containing protein [Fusibacter bizertensis]MDH8679939.1 mechanosensitive ion channel [Fusibacter bizertensis]